MAAINELEFQTAAGMARGAAMALPKLDPKAQAHLDAHVARQDHMRTKMADLPETYKQMLPVTANQAQLDHAEQGIRNAYTDEMKQHFPAFAKLFGWTPPPGSPHSEAPKQSGPQLPANWDQMSSSQQILLGLKHSTPARGRR